MKNIKRLLALALIGAMCLLLAACGADAPEPTEDITAQWDSMSADDFDEERTAWQSDDGSRLIISLADYSYTYYTRYIRVGMGSLIEGENGIELLSYSPSGSDAYCCLVKDGDGFTVRCTNGEEGEEWCVLNGLHFTPAQGVVSDFDPSALNGVWQNALGVTYAFDTEKMRFVECSGSSMQSGALYDDGRGAGIYIGGAELLYPCLSDDGNSFVLFGAENAPREAGAKNTGVFYRDGDAEAYTELDDAFFGGEDNELWYYDGVQYHAVPAGYTLGEDEQAYDKTGKPFAAPWENDRFDPASVWGENWVEDNIGE